MTLELTAVLALAVGAIVWAVRLEGRVNGHDAKNEAHTAEHDEIKAAVKEVDRKVDDLTKFLLEQHYQRRN